MPRRLLAYALIGLLWHVAAARAAEPSVSAPVANVHALLDAHEVPAAAEAIAALAPASLDATDRVALDAARGRLALLSYDLEAAKGRLTKAVADADAAGATLLAARERIWLAQCLLGLTESQQAEALTRSAYDVLVAQHDERGEFSALQLLAILERNRQRRFLERQFEIARSLQDPVLEARVRNRWSAVLIEAGRFGAGLAEAEHAERLARERPGAGGWLISHSLSARAWALRGHGDYAGALALNRQGVRDAMRYGDYESAAWNWMGVGDSLDGQLRSQEMAAAMREGLAVARRTKMPALIHSLIASVALSEYEIGRWASAARLYEEVLAKPLGDSPVYAGVKLAECERHLGRLDDALTHVDTALAVARDRAEPDSETQALAERAEILQALGRPDEARSAVLTALERLESLRRQLAPSDVLKRGFGDVHDDYAVAVDVLARQGRHAEALAAAEQARARALADLLLSRRASERTLATDDSARWQLGASADSTPPAPAALDATPGEPIKSTAAAPALDVPALAALARRLDSTLVVYWIHERGSYAWVVSGGGEVHGARLPATRTRIESLVHTATSGWPSMPVRGEAPTPAVSSPADARTALVRLYAVLMAPVEPWLPSAPGARLTIIPHGALFQLSFAALIDPRGRYLIERYATAYAPGGAALAAALTPHTDRPAGAGALLVADPARPIGPDGRALPQLTGARDEVRRVARTLADAQGDTVLVGDAATEPAVRAAAPHARLIHFAAHAFAANRAEHDPYIALASSRAGRQAGGDDGRLTATEVYGLPLSADLVVLSACRSAEGKITSDGIADLSRAFIAAGAPSVVASLWDAVDQTTAILMNEFYRDYAAGEPKDRALRDAELHLLRALRAGKVKVTLNGTKAALPESPMFWAGFVLAGAP